MNGTVRNFIEPTREQRVAELLSRTTRKPWFVCWRWGSGTAIVSDENLWRYVGSGYEILFGCAGKRQASECAEHMTKWTYEPWCVYTTPRDCDFVVCMDSVARCRWKGCQLVSGWSSSMVIGPARSA